MDGFGEYRSLKYRQLAIVIWQFSEASTKHYVTGLEFHSKMFRIYLKTVTHSHIRVIYRIFINV